MLGAWRGYFLTNSDFSIRIWDAEKGTQIGSLLTWQCNQDNPKCTCEDEDEDVYEYSEFLVTEPINWHMRVDPEGARRVLGVCFSPNRSSCSEDRSIRI